MIIHKLTNKYRELQSQYGHHATIKILSDKIGQQIRSKLPLSPKAQVFFSPWNKSFSERSDLLRQTTKKKVALFYPAPDQGTFRYRIYNMVQKINADLPDYAASYFYAAEIGQFLEQNIPFDLLIISRFDWTPQLQELIDYAHIRNVRVVYDTDDLVFDPDYLPLVAEQLEISSAELPIWQDTVARNYQAAQLADEFLCTNKFLAQKLNEKFNKPVHIIPNFLNSEQVEFARTYQKPQTDKFWLGYFSGTRSHYKDFQLIEPAIINTLRKYPEINLVLMGHFKLSSELKMFSDRIKQVKFGDFLNYLEVIGTCDLILVPLMVNDFTNCKSELKFFEAGIMKVPVVTSPTFIYKEIITDGENGMLAEETEWEDKITTIYNDKELWRKVSEEAYTYSVENYSGEKITSQIANFLKNNI